MRFSHIIASFTAMVLLNSTGCSHKPTVRCSVGNARLRDIAREDPARFAQIAKRLESADYIKELLKAHPEYEPIRDVIEGMTIQCRPIGLVQANDGSVEVQGGAERVELFDQFRSELYRKWEQILAEETSSKPKEPAPNTKDDVSTPTK
jgi:hydrogenase maturation factor HypE